MAKCAICEKGAHFGNNVSHSNRKTPKMWKSNVKSVRVKTEGGATKEIPVVAPEDGTVASINVAVGDAIESGAVLATLN